MAKTFEKLGNILDRQNYEWLLRDSEDLATGLAIEIANGGEPDAIARYIAGQIGETRAGYVNRIKSAARYIKSEQAR